MQNDMDLLKKQLKENIQKLIDAGDLKEAKALVEQYKNIAKDDAEAYSMDAVILIMENKLTEAEQVLREGLDIDENNFDLNYNLGYLYEQKKDFKQSVWYYNKGVHSCDNEKMAKEINEIINNIQQEHNIKKVEYKNKLAFFVKQGMDSFLGDIINGISDEYEIKKITVTDFKQIDEEMKWADICWFEWCDELVGYGSKLPMAKEKKIICRLHSYEAFTDYPSKVDWNKVDKLVFVAEHIKSFVVDKFKIDSKKVVVVPNGIDINKWTFKERKPGFNIAYIGYINYKKGPMLLLHTFKAIYDKDHRYKLYIAGQFQDDRDVLYFKQMIKEFGIEKNVIYEGWIDNLDEWLENKNYILCTSILESQNMSVMQAMAKGIKPLVHNFVGAKTIYPKEYVWNTIGEAVNMVESSEYSTKEYRDFVETNYLLKNKVEDIRSLVFALFDYKVKNTSAIVFLEEIKKYSNNLNNSYVEGKLMYESNVRNSIISIVTPIYNGSKFLDNLFSKISLQTIATSVEWIFIDDFSNDNSLSKCISLAKKYSNMFATIKIYSLKDNSGATSALHFGFSKSTTNFVSWLSVDDFYVSKDKLEVDIELLRNKDADIVFSNKIMFGESLENAQYYEVEKKEVDNICSWNLSDKLSKLFFFNPINGSSLVFRKSAYDLCGGFDFKLANVDGDWDLLSRAFMLKLKFLYDDRIVFNTIHEEQTSKNSQKMLIGTSITRIRMLNTLIKFNMADEFINNAKNNKLFCIDVLIRRPIFSYYFLEYYDERMKNEYKKYIKNFSCEEIIKIKDIANMMMGTKVYNHFLYKLGNIKICRL